MARRLNATEHVVVARKVGAPISPELAIGAVTANGGCYLNQEAIDALGVTAAYLARVTAEERERRAVVRPASVASAPNWKSTE